MIRRCVKRVVHRALVADLCEQKYQGPKLKCNHNCYHQYLHKDHPDRGKACEIQGVACKGFVLQIMMTPHGMGSLTVRSARQRLNASDVACSCARAESAGPTCTVTELVVSMILADAYHYPPQATSKTDC